MKGLWLLMLAVSLVGMGCTKKEDAVKTGLTESNPSSQSTVSNSPSEPVAGEPQGK